jgi:hypothetical protein
MVFFKKNSVLPSIWLMGVFACGFFDKANAWAPCLTVHRNHARIPTILFISKDPYFGDDDDEDEQDDDDDDIDWVDSRAELLADDGTVNDNADWVPDRERARRKRSQSYQSAAAAASRPAPQKEADMPKQGSSMYTDEEEELISAMGGKFRDAVAPTSKREAGFLGDSTLSEIAMDYSVPVCYLADVLCMWGVPIPISVNDRLGDLVTGEQAFAIVEAIYTLDLAALHDRYSNQSLLSVCDDYDIEVRDAFEMAIKEGWSLPFGVQTCLRVEQEEELVRVLGSI